MQARMTNPAFILPEAMQAMFALNKSIEDKLPLKTNTISPVERDPRTR